MELPADDMAWPPDSVTDAAAHYRIRAAWYSGCTDTLSQVYGGALSTLTDPANLDGNSRGLFARMRERFFWGNRPTAGNHELRAARLHIPLAADIATASADLLFGEDLRIRIPDAQTAKAADARAGSAALLTRTDPTQARLEDLLDEGGGMAALIEAAEVAAAYGGVYLRCGWDPGVADHVIIDSITPDFAVPQWRGRHLIAVTFWRDLPDPAGQRDTAIVWRHLEHYERGGLRHGLYRGGRASLGRRVDLRDHPDTQSFTALVDTAGWVSTGQDDTLSVQYVPNMLPNRHRPGSPLGRSDYDGIEPIFDALDESYTSWMRDLRLGKGRVIIPDVYLQDQGRGRGAVWDPEQEVYQTIDALPDGRGGIAMQQVQFAIRVEEHERTCRALLAQAVRGAGYSTQTFGEADDVAATATEVIERNAASYRTRAKKIRYLRPALARLLHAALGIDVAQFRPDGVVAVVPDLQWPDGVAQDSESAARTAQLLHGAQAASLYTRIKMVNPDWEDAQIQEEIGRIRGDQADEVKLQTPQPARVPALDEQVPAVGAAVPRPDPGPGGVLGSRAGGRVPGNARF